MGEQERIIAEARAALDDLRGATADAVERAAAAEARSAELDELIRAHDAGLSRLEKTVEELTRRIETEDGRAALLRALPEDARQIAPIFLELVSRRPSSKRLLGPLGAAAIGTMGEDMSIAVTACAAFFRGVIRRAVAARRGQPAVVESMDEEVRKLERALGGVGPKYRAALQEDAATEGAELVPVIVEAVIAKLLKEASVVRAAGARVLQMAASAHDLPRLDKDFVVSWTDEEGTFTDAVPAAPMSAPRLAAKKQTGLATASIELVQDSLVNVWDFVIAELIMQAGRAEDAQALEGDGTVFTGLFSATGVNAVAGGSNALSEDEIRKLIFGGEHATTVENGVIFCHPWIVRDALGLTTGSGGSPWLPFMLSGELRTRPNLFGVPVFMTSTIDRTRGAGTNETTAYHGDPSYLVIGDRLGTTIDVNPWSETEFKKGQIVLRFVRRVGVAVWVPSYFTKLTAVTVSA